MLFAFDTPSLENLFKVGNMAAMVGWIILILLPRRISFLEKLWPALQSLPTLIIPILLAIAYSGLVFSGFGGSGGDFSSLDGVRQLFTSDTVLVAGWFHYLAFDLFVGTVIASKADEIGIHRILQVPILALTFMFGPAGLLVFQMVRGGLSLFGSRR